MVKVYGIPTHPLFQNIRGERFGRLLVTGFEYKEANNSFWRCRCDCGAETVVRISALRRGNTQSCGCLNRDRLRASRIKHGQSGPDRRGDGYSSWAHMIARCHNPGHRDYGDYGARGITVCGRWRKSFADFIGDIGQRPGRKHSIERVDNDAGYWCGKCGDCQSQGWDRCNCRWATLKEQQRNKRNNRFITFRGETLCMGEWAERYGLPSSVLAHRIKRGWPLEEAMTRPPARHPGGKRQKRKARW